MFEFGDKRIPTVKFDASKITPAIEIELKAAIRETNEIPEAEHIRIFDAVLAGVKRGGDLYVIAKALETMPGNLSKAKVGEICRNLNNRAMAKVTTQRQTDLGITHAKWLYSGAPCVANFPPSESDLARDAAHKAANGQEYEVSKGIFMNGLWRRPREEPGCKCVANSVILGFD